MKVVLILVAVGAIVSGSQDVMTDLTIQFAKPLEACKKEMNLSFSKISSIFGKRTMSLLIKTQAVLSYACLRSWNCWMMNIIYTMGTLKNSPRNMELMKRWQSN